MKKISNRLGRYITLCKRLCANNVKSQHFIFSPMVLGLIYLVVLNMNRVKKSKFQDFVQGFPGIVQMTGQVVFVNSIV